MKNRTARDAAAIRKVTESNSERRRKGPQTGQNTYHHKADNRVKSGLFFAHGNEGKNRFLRQNLRTNLNTISFKNFHSLCKSLFRREKNYIIERMQLYNANQVDTEGLEVFSLRLSRQAAKSGLTQVTEKEVIRDIFMAKMKFSDIQRELCRVTP